jgi:photosystem II stability/assembly factor-like uncharacterized protein
LDSEFSDRKQFIVLSRVDSRKFLYIKTEADLYGYLSGKTFMKAVQKIILEILVFISCAQTADAQWVQTNGPYGGVITDLLINGSNVFTGTTDGIFLSSNDGNTWKQIYTGLPGDCIYSLTVNGGDIFAGAGYGGVYVSKNNGDSWAPANNGFPMGVFINKVAACGGSIIAGTRSNGIFLSKDNGNNWTQSLNRVLSSFVVNGDNIIAFANGILLSTDQGQSWTTYTNGLPNTGIISLADNGKALFAGTYMSGIFISTDNGANWTAVQGGLPEGTRVEALAASDTNVFVGTFEGGAYLSSDNGSNWKPFNRGLTNSRITSLAAKKDIVFAGTYCGVFVSSNNDPSWKFASTGLENVAALALAVIGKNVFASVGNGNVFFSDNNGKSWGPVTNGLPWNFNVYSFARIDTTIFAGGDSGVFRSSNNGANWTRINNGLPEYGGVDPLVVSNGKLFAGTGGYGIFYLNSNDENWQVSNKGVQNVVVYDLAASGSMICAGTNNGVYLTQNNGANWTRLNAEIGPFCVGIIGTVIFAGTESGMHRSTDNGNSWTKVSNGFPDTYVYSIKIIGSIIFAGSLKGIFYSVDEGSTWTRMNEGLSTDLVGDILVQSLDVSGTNLFASISSGNSIWRLPFLLAYKDSLFLFKIPITGDSLNHGYTLIAAPHGMSLSSGGTISWAPGTDSIYLDYIKYIISDDNDNKDTVTQFISVNSSEPIEAIKPRFKINRNQCSDFSIHIKPVTQNRALSFPNYSCASDLFLFNLSGRLLHQMRGITSRTITWRLPEHLKGSYILMVKNGADRLVKKITLP